MADERSGSPRGPTPAAPGRPPEVGALRVPPPLARGWRPILDGALAERAVGAIRAIAAGLADEAHQVEGAPDRPVVAARRASLAWGWPGVALFFDYLDRSGLGEAGLAERLLIEIVRGVHTGQLNASLWGGVAGVGWVVEHLARDGRLSAGAAEVATFPDEVDRRLLSDLGRPPDREREAYELLSGFVRSGVYALERRAAPASIGVLEAVVDRLDRLAERAAGAITWWTPPALTPGADRPVSGSYNLGVAHGVPGAIAWLGLACAAGVARDRARPLLDGAVAWLLAHRPPRTREQGFPSTVLPDGESHPSRLAWCYGDAGIAAALLLAARCVGEPAWGRTAIEIAAEAAARPFERSGVVDAPLCHGAFGLAHTYNRLYQATDEPALGQAARAWYARGLAMRRPAGRLGGFAAVQLGAAGTPSRRVALRGLLEGAAGVGLALLAAVTPIEPAWDRLLLVGIPPRRRGGASGA